MECVFNFIQRKGINFNKKYSPEVSDTREGIIGEEMKMEMEMMKNNRKSHGQITEQKCQPLDCSNLS